MDRFKTEQLLISCMLILDIKMVEWDIRARMKNTFKHIFQSNTSGSSG